MKDTYCPKCSTHLILSDQIKESKFLKCPTCKSSFENPHFPKPKREPIFDEETLTEIREFGSKIFKTKNLIWGSIIIIISLFLYGGLSDDISYEIYESSNTIPMIKKGGVFYVHIYINGVSREIIFDTGASSISISETFANSLWKQGKLTEKDIIGTTSFRDATGRISEGTEIILRQIQIGNVILKNVRGICKVIWCPY